MTTIRKIVTSKVDGNSADTNDTNEIRPFGEIAVYLNTEPNPDKLTLMMFDGTRTHLKSMVLAPGRLYGSDADSGDGNNRDTIKLIPDASLSDYTGNDQYLIIDPTGGIRIRAGGTQDQSTADLYIGGEQTFVRVSDTNDNVVIRTTTLGNIPIENVNVQTVDELVPPGNVWRIFIIASTYPTLGDTVQIGETVTTAWGTPVTATITDIQQDAGQWQIHVDQNIVTGFGGGPQTVTFNRGSNTWNFGQTGDLIAPGDITTGLDGVGGRFIQDCANGTTSMRWINVPQGDDTTQLIRAYTGDPKLNTEIERAQIKLNWDVTEDKSGLTIRTFDQSNPNNEVDHDWLFKGDGVLQLPVGGDIVDSEGNSVLGGGVADNNIWVQTFVSDAPTEDFPQIATSVEYDDNGNVIALFSHYQPNGEQPDSRYYSVGKYTDIGTKIWTARFVDGLNTDGWGLAVDNVDGWIYIAGQTSGGDYTYAVSTLTKIDSGNGSVAWSKIYDFGFHSSSAVVDVDSSGNPVMVGYANNDINGESYLTITKIDKTNGNVTWTRKLDGQADEQAYGMAMGPTGEVVAVGYTDYLGVLNAAATLYPEPASNPNWTAGTGIFISGEFSCTVSFVDGVPTFTNIEDILGNRSVDGIIGTVPGESFGGVTGVDDMILKVGSVTAGDEYDKMVVVKYDSTGTIQWQKAIQFDSGFDCTGADADIDSNGNIYICGAFDIDGGDTGMAIVKLDSTGAKQWSRRVVGNCISTATSIVVGPDDKLYISGVNGNVNTETFNWVVAKFSLDGLVEWQRFVENTDSWTFGGTFFGPDGGGSNLAVRQGYVALAGGFGNLAQSQQPYAAVLQVSDTGDVFAVGPWDFTAANLSGTLNATASDITVVNAGLADSDNALTVSADSVTLETEVSNFLVGTLYTAPGGNASLVNGVYSVSLGNTGTVTLPAGGTITEGIVTSNPTIQLTPASPDVASQKLVIKGGGAYNYTDNGININYNTNTAIVGDTLTFYISSNTYADQTLYWWIYPEGAGISDPGSGTVVLSGSSGSFSFDLDSDDNEFTVRVSPEDNNYDPANVGVETGLINPDAPTFDSEHHLHLTTGNLAETSIFLGTDDQNVRTTVNGGIEITTPNIDTTNVWQFGTDGSLQIPGDIKSETGINIDINLSDSTLRRWQFGEDGVITLPNTMTIDGSGTGGQTVVIGGDDTRITIDNNGAPPGFSVTTNATGTAHTWRFGPDGELTFPNDKIKAPISNNISIETEVPISDPPATIVISGADFTAVNLTYIKDGANSIWYPAGYNPATDPYIEFGMGFGIFVPGFDQALYVNTGSLNEPLAQWDTNPPLGSVAPTGVYTYPNTYTHAWQFGTDGSLTFPDSTVQTTAADFGYLDLDKDTIKGTAGYQYTFATDGYFTNSTSSESTNYFFVVYNTTNANIAAGWTVVGGTANTTVSSVTYPVTGYPGVIRVNLTAAASSTSGFYPVTVTSPDRLRVEIQPNPGTNNKFAFTTSGLTFPDGTTQSTAYTIYLLEAYASETYTLPGSFTEDVCRYSYISNTVNVPSGWFNTSTYTFTPLKAGYWEITAVYDVYRNSESSMAIKKNTTIVASAGSFNAVAQQITKIIYLNGSTDYIQIFNYGGAALSRSQYETRSWFQARWVGE